MLVELPARLLDRLICATTSRRGSHDFGDANVGGTTVISGHAATHVALGDDADQLEADRILDHRRAAAG